MITRRWPAPGPSTCVHRRRRHLTADCSQVVARTHPKTSYIVEPPLRCFTHCASLCCLPARTHRAGHAGRDAAFLLCHVRVTSGQVEAVAHRAPLGCSTEAMPTARFRRWVHAAASCTLTRALSLLHALVFTTKGYDHKTPTHTSSKGRFPHKCCTFCNHTQGRQDTHAFCIALDIHVRGPHQFDAGLRRYNIKANCERGTPGAKLPWSPTTSPCLCWQGEVTMAPNL